MKPRTLRLVLSAALLLLCASSLSFAQRSAPSFTVQGLNGGTISSDSFRNDTLLLEFWATWCPYCKKDQHALDTIASEYASKGVSVLAVDIGESAETVQQYLRANPRSVDIALDPTARAVRQFGGGGVPEYVLIDHGNLVGIHSGAAGEEGLRRLLSHSGSGSGAQPTTQQASAGGPAVSAGGAGIPRWVTVPPSPTSNRKPLPKTVFVLSSGESIESDNYTMTSGYTDVIVGDQQRRILVSELDVQTTMAVNRKRGVDLKIPTNKNEVFLGF